MKNTTPEDKRIAALAAEFDKEREQNPFVTLQAVIEAVALHVEVETSELEQYAWPPLVNKRESDHGPLQEQEANAIKLLRFLQYSRSARRLHRLFAEDAPEIKWYDFNHESANIISTDDARNRGLKILAPLAGAERQFSRAWEKAEMRLRWVQDPTHIEPPNLELHMTQETELIGFKFSDVMAVLDTHEIVHSQPYRSLTFPTWQSGLERRESATKAELANVPAIKVPPDGISRFPSSSEVATAFAGLLDKDEIQWKGMLKDPPKWLKSSRAQKGRKGTDGGATWNPIAIARHLADGVMVKVPIETSKGDQDQYNLKITKVQLPLLGSRFLSDELKSWLSEWKDLRYELEKLKKGCK